MRAGPSGKIRGRRSRPPAPMARRKNVKIWIWVHSREVRDPQARKEFFRKAVEAGVVGVKIDFPPACNREVSNWYYDVAKDAADVHLLSRLPWSEQADGYGPHLA